MRGQFKWLVARSHIRRGGSKELWTFTLSSNFAFLRLENIMTNVDCSCFSSPHIFMHYLTKNGYIHFFIWPLLLLLNFFIVSEIFWSQRIGLSKFAVEYFFSAFPCFFSNVVALSGLRSRSSSEFIARK